MQDGHNKGLSGKGDCDQEGHIRRAQLSRSLIKSMLYLTLMRLAQPLVKSEQKGEETSDIAPNCVEITQSLSSEQYRLLRKDGRCREKF